MPARTPRTALGLAVSSLGVTLGPPLFGADVEWAGGYRRPRVTLAFTMARGLLLALWSASAASRVTLYTRDAKRL